jgi:hypothetical protein
MTINAFWIQSCRVCDDVGIPEVGGVPKPTGSGNIDGVDYTSGTAPMSMNDRVLLTSQPTKKLNGVWLWQGVNTPMIRPSDFNSTNNPATNMSVVINDGTKYVHSTWRLLTTGSIVVDTNDLSFGPHDQTVNVRQFGARGDVKFVSDAVLNGTSTLTSNSANFNAALDTGKLLVVIATNPVVTTIATVNSTTQITMASSTSYSGTGLSASYATDDTAAIQSAVTAAVNYRNNTVLFPAAEYWTTAAIIVPGGIHLTGPGSLGSVMITHVQGAAGAAAVTSLAGLLTPSNTGGTLVAGDYFLCYTLQTTAGAATETTPGPTVMTTVASGTTGSIAIAAISGLPSSYYNGTLTVYMSRGANSKVSGFPNMTNAMVKQGAYSINSSGGVGAQTITAVPISTNALPPASMLGDCFVFTGTASTGFAGTGGGVRNLLIVKQKGCWGGAAIRLVGSMQKNSQWNNGQPDYPARPGEMVIENVLCYGSGTVGQALWDHTLRADGSQVIISGGNGVRDMKLSKLRGSSGQTDSRDVWLTTCVGVSSSQVQVDAGTRLTGSAGVTVDGDSDYVSLNGVAVEGNLVVQDPAKDFTVTGHASTLQVQGTSVNGSSSLAHGNNVLVKSRLFAVAGNYKPRIRLYRGTTTGSAVTGDGTDYVVAWDGNGSPNYLPSYDYTSGSQAGGPGGGSPPTYITVPAAGVWRISARVTLFGMVSTNNLGGIRILLNGATYASQRLFNPYASGTGSDGVVTHPALTVEIYDELELVYGDTVGIDVVVASGTKAVSVYGDSAGAYTNFTACLV